MFKAFFELARFDEGKELSAFVTAALVFPVVLTLLAVIWLRAGDEQAALSEVTLATGEWAPYTGKNLAQGGSVTALVRATFERMGYEPRLEYMPWPLTEAKAADNESTGGIRAAFPFVVSEGRKRTFHYSAQPLATVGYGLYYRTSLGPQESPATSVHDLPSPAWILVEGYEYPAAVRRAAEAHGSVRVPDLESALEHLATSDQLYLYYEATEVFDRSLRERRPDLLHEVTRLEPDGGQDGIPERLPLYLVSSKNNPHNHGLMKAFDEALAELVEQGMDQAIRSEARMRQSTVLLQPTPEAPIIHVDNAAGTFVVPRGTRALVQHWGAAFYPHDDPDDPPGPEPLSASVQLLDGPMAGSTVTVDGRFLEIQDSDP